MLRHQVSPWCGLCASWLGDNENSEVADNPFVEQEELGGLDQGKDLTVKQSLFPQDFSTL